MKKVLAVLALAVLVIGGLTGCRFNQNKQAEAAHKDDTVEFAKADFLGFTKQMREATGEQGADRLKKLADGFPHTDSGIGYQQRFDVREEGESRILTLKVGYVWKGSAAEKAGIQPGDLISAVSGTGTKFKCAKDNDACPTEEEIAKVRAAIAEIDTKPATYYLDGKGTVRVIPVPYGKDIHDYITSNLDGYGKQLAAIVPKIAALEEKVAKAPDRKTLEALVPEANALASEISAVYQSVETYIKTRVIFPEPVTEARPVL